MNTSLPCSSIDGIFQARVLEWVAISFSRGSSNPRDQTCVSLIAGRQFTAWATREANDPVEVGNLISGFSTFSKSSLSIWKFLVHVLLKSSLENFEHYFGSVWGECKCGVLWTFFGIAFICDWNENWLFQSCGHCWIIQICWYIACSTFTASSFSIGNSSAGIPSYILALFIVKGKTLST